MPNGGKSENEALHAQQQSPRFAGRGRLFYDEAVGGLRASAGLSASAGLPALGGQGKTCGWLGAS